MTHPLSGDLQNVPVTLYFFSKTNAHRWSLTRHTHTHTGFFLSNVFHLGLHFPTGHNSCAAEENVSVASAVCFHSLESERWKACEEMALDFKFHATQQQNAGVFTVNEALLAVIVCDVPLFGSLSAALPLFSCRDQSICICRFLFPSSVPLTLHFHSCKHMHALEPNHRENTVHSFCHFFSSL